MSLATPVVLDLGTGYLKVGRSSSPIPEFVLPNMVGRPLLRSDEAFSREKLKDIMISDETIPVAQYLDLSLPVTCGIVKDWDEETMVLDYVWREKLKIRPEEHPCVITEAPANPKENRRKLVEVFFETFGFDRIQIMPQALLVLYAQGLTTGVIVDSGDGVSHIMPICECYLLPHLITRMDIAGRSITEHMSKLLTLRGYSFHKTSDFDLVRSIKEKLCFVSADVDMDRRIANETTTYVVPYTLPDGRIIKVSGERFEAPEILFQPDKLGYEGKGLSELVFETIMKADITLRRQFFESIVVSGGTAMFPGLSTRIANDLRKLLLRDVLKGDVKALDEYKIHVDDPPNRRFLVYAGGTVIAELTKGQDGPWATRQEYKDLGADRVMTKWQSVNG